MKMRTMKTFGMTRTKKKMSSLSAAAPRKTAAALLFAALVGIPSASLLVPQHAFAQQKKEATQRLVEGTVTDKGDKPLPGAVVYLKDSKTLTVKSYLTDEAGHFRFGQLSLTTDYDLWATVNGKRSKTRSISSFNSRPTLDFTLKVDAEPGVAAENAPPATPPPTTPQKAAEGTAAPLSSK